MSIKGALVRTIAVSALSALIGVAMTACTDNSNPGGGGGGLAAPAPLTAVAVSSTEIELRWSAVAGALGYNVYASLSPSSGFQLITTSQTTSARHSGIPPGTSYYYKVSAFNANGVEGAMSTLAFATTLNSGDPSNQTPVASDYTFGNLSQAAGDVTAVTVTAKSGKSSGAVTVYYEGISPTSHARSTNIPQAAGTYAVTFNVAAASGWNAASGLSAGTLTVHDASALPTINIENKTGVSIPYAYLKPSGNIYWGVNRLITTLANNASRTITLTKPLSENNVYDFVLSTQESGGTAFRRYTVTVSDGATITFTDANISNGSESQQIVLLNRIGRGYDRTCVKVSGTEWADGGCWGSVSNNNDGSTLTIDVPSSVSTKFDFQLRATNPDNTYTKTDVTISRGMKVMFTSADSDTELTGKPVIVIVNNVDNIIPYVYIRPAGSESWGPDLLSVNLLQGDSYTFTLSEPLSVQDRYDIYLRGAFSGQYVKWDVEVTEGMILTFDETDLN